MEKIYVLKKDMIIRGPYTKEIILARGLKVTDKIWYEGLIDWQLAGNIEELKPAIEEKRNVETNIPFMLKVFSFLK